MRRIPGLAVAIALAGGLFANSAWSQDRVGLLFDYGRYYAQEEPTPAPPAPGPVAPEESAPGVAAPEGLAPIAPSEEPAPATSPSDVLPAVPEPAVVEPVPDAAYGEIAPGAAMGGAAPAAGPAPPTPWTLPQPYLLQRLGVKVGGWLEQGITFNSEDPADGFNGPLFTNDWDREYQMNQLWLFFDRPADNDGYGMALGGHIDLIYGSDWRFGIQDGLEDGFQNPADSYGLVFPQIYFEVALNRLSLKLGHFAGILSYEVVPAPMNPFYSHALEYAAVPELVTGLLGDYKLTDQLSVQAGFHRGWMQWEDRNNELDFMAGVKWNSSSDRTSIAYAISAGPQDPLGIHDIFVSSLVLKHQLTDRFQYVLVHNLGTIANLPPQGQDGEWYGLNQYFLYSISPQLSANLRFEWFRDDDGGIIRGLGTVGRRGWAGAGYAGDFYELTMGVTWRLRPNVMLRPEVRWDWYEGQPSALVPGLPFPYDAGAKDEQFTYGADLILTY